MKLLRPLLLGIILAGAFFYFTTYHRPPGGLTNLIGHPNKVEISEAATGAESLDAEEQNNIDVYRKNIGRLSTSPRAP